MPETAAKMLAQQSGQFDLDAARNKFVVDAVGSVANDPKLTREDFPQRTREMGLLT